MLTGHAGTQDGKQGRTRERNQGGEAGPFTRMGDLGNSQVPTGPEMGNAEFQWQNHASQSSATTRPVEGEYRTAARDRMEIYWKLQSLTGDHDGNSLLLICSREILAFFVNQQNVPIIVQHNLADCHVVIKLTQHLAWRLKKKVTQNL